MQKEITYTQREMMARRSKKSSESTDRKCRRARRARERTDMISGATENNQHSKCDQKDENSGFVPNRIPICEKQQTGRMMLERKEK